MSYDAIPDIICGVKGCGQEQLQKQYRSGTQHNDSEQLAEMDKQERRFS